MLRLRRHFFSSYKNFKFTTMRLPSYRRQRTFTTIFCLFIFLVFFITLQNSPFSSDLLFASQIFSKPLVTVIITSHNVQPYIHQAISSVRSQRYTNLQIIIVDDASTDGTSDIIHRAAANDSRIEFIQLPVNTVGGVGTSANIGLDRAKGKYIAFVDGDDFVERTLVSRLVPVAEWTNADLVYFQMDSYNIHSHSFLPDMQRNIWPPWYTVWLSQRRSLSITNMPFVFQFIPYPWRKLYRRDYLNYNRIRFSEGDYVFEDNAFQQDVLSHDPRISFVSERLIHYRVGRKAQTVSMYDRNEIQKFTRSMPPYQYVLKNTHFAKIVNLIPVLNRNTYRVATCERLSQHQCQFMRQVIRRWMPRFKHFFLSLKYFPDTALLHKVFFLYFRTIARWEKHFDLPYADSEKWSDHPEKNLSIIVSTKNDAPNLARLFASLEDVKQSSEFIFVDNNSSDRTVTVLKDHADSKSEWYVLQSGKRGVGRAMNFGQLFADSKYVMWMDGCEEVNGKALTSAVNRAIEKDVDMMLLKYDETKQSEIGIFRNDSWREIWSARPAFEAGGEHASLADFGRVRFGKLVKTELLRRYEIFHGSTERYYDVPFFWHTMLLAESIEVFEEDAVLKGRRKREAETEDDVLNVPVSVERTNRALLRMAAVMDSSFRAAWRTFAKEWMVSARKLTKSSFIQRVFDERVREADGILVSQ